MVVPGMRGNALAQVMIVIRPKKQVLFVCGYFPLHHGDLLGGSKLRYRETLLRMVREVLTKRESQPAFSILA
jgi:hypothetical protein